MYKKSMNTGFGIGLIALGALACGGPRDSENEYLQGAPEQAALELSITGDVDSEGLATDDDAVAAHMAADALGSIELALDAPGADGLVRTRGAVRELNQALRSFLEPLAALVRNVEPDRTEANVAMWGPVERGATEYRFFVRKGLLRRYGWLLQARPGGSEDMFSNVAAGNITVGAIARRGRGALGIDLDTLGSVDPTVNARGKVLAAFAHGPRGNVLAYRLRDFSAEAGDTTPIDAAFQGVHLSGGHNRLRLAFHGNLPDTATEAEELVLARVRHQRGEGGRADFLVLGGDIADGKLWVVSECWNRELGSAYRVVRECPGDGPGGAECVEQRSSGDAAACLGDLAVAELPPLNPEEHMDDAESPEADLLPPDELPSGEAP
jgi:hypothetical protein